MRTSQNLVPMATAAVRRLFRFLKAFCISISVSVLALVLAWMPAIHFVFDSILECALTVHSNLLFGSRRRHFFDPSFCMWLAGRGRFSASLIRPVPFVFLVFLVLSSVSAARSRA
ncbi:hypothetical protein C8R45DRAFT_990979 [Mycena sanguinolenta]|nr:hypothetical protein C8R45DRAFT_990979 [Mycena sanguinolenta]